MIDDPYGGTSSYADARPYNDMDLAAGMVESQGSAGNDGHRVFFVRYACKPGATLKRSDVRVDIIRECLVPNAWHAVPDEFESRRRWKMQREIY